MQIIDPTAHGVCVYLWYIFPLLTPESSESYLTKEGRLGGYLRNKTPI